MARRKSNKQIKAMMRDLYAESLANTGTMWAFDRLRLVECNFKRKKLRYPQTSKVSIYTTQAP